MAIPSNAFVSSRLTAFVLKILSLAQDQVGGSAEKLQETATWLLSQQRDNGSFHDPCPVIHREMQLHQDVFVLFVHVSDLWSTLK